jgi:adenine-specific DNA-methyltransferase
LTGYNEAFIIDTETRNRILANCRSEQERKRTEEIIKPVLRGRDIERYYYKWAGLWVIIIPAGWTNKHRGRENPEEFFKKTFPALYKHFMNFSNVKTRGKGLFDRDDQGDYWWELRPCDYYPEFEKEKIVWQKQQTK